MNKAFELEGAGAGRGARRCVAALAFALVASPAFGWNETGHVISALIAYDGLSDSAREWAMQTLRAHPRFQENFDTHMPRTIARASAAERDRWYFAAAATWPDEARRFDDVADVATREALVARYNHGRWHYINLPTYLQPADREAHPLAQPSMAWSPTLDPAGLDIVQALAMLFANRCAPSQTDADRALALSWLLHLVADLHQPLHTTALYGAPAFERGDRGGNDIPLAGGGNLHALWDAGLGSERRWQRLESAARRYAAAAALRRDDVEVSDFPHRIRSWAEDGRALADRVVYSPDVRAALIAAAPGHVAPLQIGMAYRAVMRETAARQIVLAGRRTSALIELLHTDVTRAHCGR